jgi:hypothetical protein
MNIIATLDILGWHAGHMKKVLSSLRHIMLAVVKTPRTNIKMRGFIPAPVLRVLRTEFGNNPTVTAYKGESELENVFGSVEYMEF